MKRINAIFIIDDDPITVFGIRKMLNSTVDCADISSHGNGKLALESIKRRLNNNQEIPEVIFLDINMPIMDGWQFLDEFITLSLPQKVRINIVTSSIDPLDRRNWKHYESRTHHTITFNNKPLKKEHIQEITQAA